MSTLRRTLVVLVTAVALGLGLAGTASATWNATTTRSTMGVSTATLAAPTNPAAQLTSCNNGRWMNVSVSWTASTSSRVTGYTVKAYRSDGTVSTVATVGAGTTQASTTVDKLASGTTTAVFTVTATIASWTAESVKSGAITC